MVRYADHLLGKEVAHLDEAGLRKNTLIVWTTDNGTDPKLENKRNGRLVQGGKAQTTENGVNAPFIVNWPGHVPEGVTSDALVDFTDMLPTFADFADGKMEEAHTCDGVLLRRTPPRADCLACTTCVALKVWERCAALASRHMPGCLKWFGV